MLLTLHDANLSKVAFIDNDKSTTLNYFDDTWVRDLETGSSTFEFSIYKKSLKSDTAYKKAYNYLNERAFVSFKYKNQTYLFNVITVEEDETTIKCYCENLNLELINEHTNPFKADRAMTFVEYCNAMDLLNMTKLTIGRNEITDYKRTLEWEGQDTKLARLLSLANKFDAEIDFETWLNDDSTLKTFKLNVYHENDDTHQGVGRVRSDIRLVYGKNLKSITRKVDKKGIFNMIVPTTESESEDEPALNIGGLPDWEIKNDEGVVEFYKKGTALYAPISARLYPSTFTSETSNDQWIRHDMTFDVKSASKLESEALKQLKSYAYPALTYTVKGFVDVDVGDTVNLTDKGFVPTLLLTARVTSQKISFTQPTTNETTFANFRALKNELSTDIQSRLEELIESSKPYTIRVASTNGTAFKNNVGESTITATLLKGNKVISDSVTWRWAIDGVVTTGMTYTVKASEITEQSVLTVAAYIGNDEVATTEIDVINVNDGVDGAKGDKGDKGDDGRGLERSEDFYQLTSTGTAPSYPIVGGRNLLKNSKRAFKPDTSKIDNYQIYSDSTVSLENGKEYVISAETDGYLTSIHETTKESDNVVLWIVKPDIGVNAIVSNDRTATTGSKFVWENPTGTYSLRVNTYRAVATKSVWNVKIERGSVKTPYSQAPEDLGWSTDTKVPTTDKRFLWKLHIDYFSDRTVEILQPIVTGVMGEKGIQGLQGPKGDQGIPGVAGEDGRTQYTHIAYADSATGGGFSQTDQTKAYIGMYQDFNVKDSTNPTDYRWSKWHGEDGAQGIPGKPGADGKTPYIHFAYADDNKGTNFSLTDKNQQYQGYYSDYTEADSSDYKKYTWVYRLANVQVGGTNLLRNTRSFDGSNISGSSILNGDTYKNCAVRYFKNTDASSSYQDVIQFSNCLYPTLGGTYTVSFWAKGNFSLQVFFYGASGFLGVASGSSSQGQTTNRDDGLIYINLSSNWQRYYVTYKLKDSPASAENVYKHLLFRHDGNSTTDEVYLAGVQLEVGNIPTDYSPNPQDVQEEVDSKADSVLTQEQLNALAEKNALIQAEMEAKASMDTVNQWITAYQNYVNANEADKKKSEQALQDASNRLLQVKYDVNDLKQQWNFIDTYMSVQNEGLIIGKSDGSAYAKFSNDRISLFSGNSEVMYISQGTLNIANGIFTKTIQIGRFRFETHPADKDMLVLRYLGG